MMRIYILTIFLILIASNSFAEFTADDRSWMHTTASYAIAQGCSAGIVVVGGERSQQATISRRWFCALSSAGVGLVKEYIIDGHPDYGDLAFNFIGYAPLFLGSDKLLLGARVSDDIAMLSITVPLD